jgi:hypothetical protein
VTKTIPFYTIASDSGVIVAVLLRGERPQKSDVTLDDLNLRDALWDIAQMAWQKLPEARPPMKLIMDVMLALRPSSGNDGVLSDE